MHKLVASVGLQSSVAVNFNCGYSGVYLGMLFSALAFGDQQIISALGGNLD